MYNIINILYSEGGGGREIILLPRFTFLHKNTPTMITAPVKWTRPRPIFLSQQIRRIILSLYYCNQWSVEWNPLAHKPQNHLATPLSQIKN